MRLLKKILGKTGPLAFGAILATGFLLGAGGALVTVVAVERTSGVEFCSTCHSMAPMVAAYRIDVHGGKNKNGLRTKCTACHLPHDNVLHYMYQKTVTGIEDVVVETFGRPDRIDWEKRRSRRERFTYDSGCVKCHEDLRVATMPNPKAFIAHKDYFMGTSDKKTCVSCHENVGHKNLGLFLAEAKGPLRP
ncbi:MAG: cytochrome C [Kiritimatiellaeota bacterium]|nr:cytochrome C [Kiritimatiellota bacterium]